MIIGPQLPLRSTQLSWLIASAISSLVACDADQTSERPAVPEEDLSAQCEAHLNEASIADLQPLPWRYEPDQRFGSGTEHPIGRVAGATWHEDRGELFVLDAIGHHVKVYNAAGDLDRIMGRQGEGPGEFTGLGGSHGSRHVFNQIALAGDNHVAVQTLATLHIFTTEGEFVDRIPTNGLQAGPYASLHLASWYEGRVLSGQTDAMRLDTEDWVVKTRMRLLQSRVEPAAVQSDSLSTKRNPLDRLPPFDGAPPQDPFTFYYARTWDALPSGLLAVISLHRHGVCFFDQHAVVRRSYGVAAPVIEMDRAGRTGFLNHLRQTRGPTAMSGRRWEEVFEVWPEAAPAYSDLMLSSDSVAWVKRHIPGSEPSVDLYHYDRGYLGTLEPLGPRLPIAALGECVLVTVEEIGDNPSEESFYGLEQWCPQAG